MINNEYIVVAVILFVIVFSFRKREYNKEEHKFIDATGRLIDGSIEILVDGILSSHPIKKGVVVDGVDFRKASHMTIYNKKSEVLYCMDYVNG